MQWERHYSATACEFGNFPFVQRSHEAQLAHVGVLQSSCSAAVLGE